MQKKMRMQNTKKNMSLSILALGFGLSAVSASAEVVCQPAVEEFYPKEVAWDIETGSARIKNFDFNSAVHSGRVVYLSPHNEFGEKINILVPIEPDEEYKRDHIELIAFPINDTGSYRVMGAAFITTDGERRIDYLFPSAAYNCIEM